MMCKFHVGRANKLVELTVSVERTRLINQTKQVIDGDVVELRQFDIFVYTHHLNPIFPFTDLLTCCLK